MMERVIAGKHKCGKDLLIRTTEVKNCVGKIVMWIMLGVCEKCETACIQGHFEQSKQPMKDKDFTVDYDKIFKEPRIILE